jgi:hypothetical protein
MNYFFHSNRVSTKIIKIEDNLLIPSELLYYIFFSNFLLLVFIIMASKTIQTFINELIRYLIPY